MTDANETTMPALSDEVRKAVTSATSELFERFDRAFASMPQPVPQENQPKGFMIDPMAMLDSVGMGYRSNPSRVTYETLRQMTEGDTLLGCIIGTRVAQVSTFCMEQENKYSVGNLIRLKGKHKRNRPMTNGEKDRAKKVEFYVENMGQKPSLTRDGFVPAVKKMLRDSLTFDQVNTENQLTRGGQLHQTVVHDPATIRFADTTKWNPRGAPLSPEDEKTRVLFAQVLNGEIITEFTAHELGFGVRNPRSNVRVGNYGYPEPQQLLQTITSHLWAEQWNQKAFSQGSTVKGVLNMKGNIDRMKYDAFKRQWLAQVGGITNAWRTPIINSDGIEFVPMQMSNTEMGYQMWIEYLVKIACSIYQMDPTEINFDLRGSSNGQQPTFVSNNEAQQKMSKDRGLKPLLRFFQDYLNRHIVSRIDDEFELAFVGLDAKSEEQAVELRQKQGQTMITVNELRELEDLKPIKGGEIIMNPTFTSYLQQLAQAQQQGGQPGAGGQPGMPGGDDQQEQEPAEQPYANRFGYAGDPQSQSGQQAGQKMQQAAQGQQPQDEHVDDADISMLRRNDWKSSIHASVRDNDLRKSTRNEVAECFDISLD